MIVTGGITVTNCYKQYGDIVAAPHLKKAKKIDFPEVYYTKQKCIYRRGVQERRSLLIYFPALAPPPLTINIVQSYWYCS